jgi:phage antirepressor YoqD-like protein
MSTITTYSYEGTPIAFERGAGVMINATQMAKRFGKTPKDWLRNQQSEEFISTLSAVRQICLSQLVQVRKGNSSNFEQGTWMHEDVAMEFARWLSPAFAIWTNDRIKELLRDGVTTTATDDQTIAKAMAILQSRLEEAKRETARLRESELEAQAEAQFLRDRAEEDAPKVLFADAVTASKRSILVGELAKILKQNGHDTGQNRLFAELREQGYLQSCKGERYNQPTQMAMELGLFELKKTAINNPDGTSRVCTTTKVTPKGQQYFIKRYLNHGKEM